MEGGVKGVAWLSVMALATVGALSFVPEAAWEHFPQALAPARKQLARIGVAPTKYYCDDASETSTLATSDSAFERAPSRKDDVPATPRDGSRVKIGGRSVEIESPKTDDFQSSDSRFTGVSTATPDRSPVQGASAASAEPDLAPEPVSSQDFPTVEVAPPPVVVDDSNSVADDEFFSSPTKAPLDFAAPSEFDSSSFAPTNPAFASPAPNAAAEPSLEKKEDELQRSFEPSASLEEIAAETEALQNAVDSPPPMPDALYETTRNDSERIPGNPAGNPAGNPSAIPPVASLATQTGAAPNVAAPDCANPLQCAPTSSTPLGATASRDAEFDAALVAAQKIESAEQAREIFLTLNRLRREYVAAKDESRVSRANKALDRLAYEVFYNPERAILEPPRVVRQGETLASIAREYQVAPETLAAINGIEQSVDAPLAPGATIKTVRGPVTAELSESRKELLLNFNNLYAGRFKFGVPQQATNLRGEFVVENKIVNPVCDAVDVSGAKLTIAGGSPENPLGSCWIGLNGGCGLQGTNRPELIGTTVPENGGFVFSNLEISQLNLLLPIGASVYFLD